MAQSIGKANGRDKKRFKRINGMRSDGQSVKLIQQIQINRAEKSKKKESK